MKTERWSYTLSNGYTWKKSHILFVKLAVCVLAIFTSTTVSQEEYPPQQITEQPASGDPKPENVIKRLTCQASSYPTPVYSWLKDGTFLLRNTSQNVYEIPNLQRSDAGEYRCLAGNKLGAFLSQPAHVVVAYMEMFQPGNTETTEVHEGRAVILNLPPLDSVPDPDIDWKQNNSTLSAESIYHHVTLQKNLVLLSNSISDSGRQFQARAVNGFSGAGSQSQSHVFVINIVEHGNRSAHLLPEMISPPVSVIANEGDSDVKVECVINARPINYLSISWFKVTDDSRTEIERGGRYLLSPFKRVLTIKSPVRADNGVYECEGKLSIPGGPQYPSVTKRANITIRERPLITPPLPTTLEKDFSETVELVCEAVGQPAPSFTWYYNGRKVKLLGNARYRDLGNGTLIIESIDLPDSGVFQCIASNGAGEVSASTWLKVNSSPPRFVTSPQDLTVVETNEARFPCAVTGAPQPVITWKKVTPSGEETISSGGRFQILDNGLLLMATTLKSDSAVYRCIATNIRGNASEEATLQVIIKTQIVRPPQNITAILSTSATLECGVTRDENVQVVWKWYFYKKPDYVEQPISNSGRHLITQQGSLIISGVAGQDIGRYKCQVISPGGNDSRVATLMVIELPRRPVVLSVVLHTTKSNTVTIQWRPAYDGNSPIQRYIISYRDEVQNGNNENARWVVYPVNISPDKTSQDVSGLQAARYYKFRISAVNSVGEGNSSQPKPDQALQMPPQPPSSPPKNFYCSPRPDRAILIQWQPPDESTWNGALLGYTISYKIANYPDTALQFRNVTGQSSTQYLLDNLVYYSQYEVKIAAFNIKGTGNYSNAFLVWTVEGRPTAPPTNVTLTSPNSTTLLVTWLPPDPSQINGVNLGYTIELRRKTITQTEQAVFVPSDPNNLYDTQEKLIFDLRKFTEYVATIVCRTTAGPGPASPPQTARTQEDVPGEVGDLRFDNIQDTTLRVSWTVPLKVNGILQGYKLWYEKKNQTATRIEIDLIPSLSSYTIQRLMPTTMYHISVAALTRKGMGPFSSADIASGVPPELPTAPYNLGITNMQARSVLLQYLPGSTGKTSITLWIVEALEGTSSTWREIYTRNDPDAREILVQNLRPYTQYKLRLIAENIVGRSNASLPTRIFETLQDAPGGPPGNVTVRALNSTAFRISWIPLPSKDWNGEPQGYKLYYRMKEIDPTADFTVLPLENGMNMESFILGHLQEWVEYEVKMTSYNDVGVSSDSPVAIERTRESVPSASPSRVKAVAKSSTSINITWGHVPLLQQNGMILGYKIKYSAPTEGIDAKFEVVDHNETTHFLLSNLRKFVSYQIQVLAYTRMGDGVLSNVETDKTFEDFPGPPIIIYFPDVTYSSAKIVWSPPSEPNGIITQYKIAYSIQGSSNQSSIELPSGDLENTVFGLIRETYYVFSVTAKTRLGWGETANVTVYTMNDRSRPDSPSTPTIGGSQVTAREVTISWSPGNDNYGPLRNYTIQYQSCGGDWTTVPDAVHPDTTSHIVSRLRPNTCYKFRVAATNDVGTSDYSNASAGVHTLSAKPEGAPRNLKVAAVTTTSINATWEQPERNTWNGQIVGYNIQYRQLQLPDYQEESVPFEQNSILLQNLIVSMHYEVRILAFNGIGQGPPSTPATIYVGEAAPTAPPSNEQVAAQSPSVLVVSWNPPPPNTQNGGLSGYKVLYWLNGTLPSDAEQIIVVESRAELTSLETFSTYYMTVQAYNLAGEGPKTSVFRGRTLEGIPGPPGALMFTNITLTKMTVKWSPPARPNGVIFNYELVYFLQKVDGETKLVKLTLDGSQHHITIDSLEENSSYTFQVSARTAKGTGSKTNGTVSTGPQPGSPGSTSAPTLEEKEKLVILSWVNGAEGNTAIYGYMIQAKAESKEKYSTIMQKNSREPTARVSFQSLTPNTEYTFRIIAINSDGISPPSEPSALRRTPGPAVAAVGKPFHSEWWFLVIIALTGVIVILIIISLLCLIGRRKNSKDKMKRSATSTTVMSEPAEPEDGGFPSMELTQPVSRRSLHLRNGTAKNIYARSPPRPSPASVTYSDDDAVAKAPLPDDDCSSITEKPSDFEDSDEPSDDDSEFDDSEKSPSSPPPPPFGGAHYVNNDVRQSWKYPTNSNAYAYTDSEAESSHYGISLQGGHVLRDRDLLSNRAGSRAPVTGFSSFV
ncbi:protein sidekick-2-like isoform X1 [Haliotis cracherodii]|uniref:protein sidekick-2-like isoform X1 n=1 Tax=Haliotis cracherodii TaxID=6455 RepID=UPI0039E90697